MISKNQLFTIIDVVESTNNYAMGQLHAGLAAHGQTWFANEQWGGRGQRENKWLSQKGENVIMTIVVKPGKVFQGNLFFFSAFIAGVCHRIFSAAAGYNTHIKWPNDIYFGDRKAGGILIENVFKGKEWSWAVVGIGLNINQISFANELKNATSLKCITNNNHDPITIASQIQNIILGELKNSSEDTLHQYLKYYNNHLFKKGQMVKLKKANIVFETRIKEVNSFGQLITEDAMDRTFEFGEISWIL